MPNAHCSLLNSVNPRSEIPNPKLKQHQLRAGARRLAIITRALELRATGQTGEAISRSLNQPIGTLHRWINSALENSCRRLSLPLCNLQSEICNFPALTAADCAPQNHKAGRPAKFKFADAEQTALAANLLRTNRTESDGSVQEAVRIARRSGDLSPQLIDEVNRREAAGLPLLPKSLHQQIALPPVAYHQHRNPTDADLDYLCAPGTMMWVEDELTGGQRIPVRAGDILEADDATINFPVCVPWPIGGCKVSDRWGVKVGRFQWLVAIDVASRFIPGFSYTARPRGSYRAEDIVSLLLNLFRAHGVWRRCRFERGVFESDLVTSLLENLGIIHRPVWSPHQKPFIEGLFNTLWTKLSLMPGQVGRFMGEMEEGNALLTKCLSGSTDPRRHFPMIDQALTAMQQAIAEKNQTPIHSKNYGSWVPSERWASQRDVGSSVTLAPSAQDTLCPDRVGPASGRFYPFDQTAEFLFAPCIREWTVQGALIGGAIRITDGWSVQFDFGADFLLEFDGCKVKAYFDPFTPAECAATIVLAENIRNRRVGEVLGVAPQINEVARHARLMLGYGNDPDRGLEHRIKTAASMRREIRSILPNGKTQSATSEARDGLGNALKVEVGTGRVGTVAPRGPSSATAFSRLTNPTLPLAANPKQISSQAALIRQLAAEVEEES